MCPSKATDRYLCPVTNKTGVKKKKKEKKKQYKQGPLLSCFSKLLCTKCTENLVLVDNRNQVSMNLFKASQKKQELVKA